jgi:hypothetical protein
MTTYVSTKDVAKLVRQHLKSKYLGEKFSVRSESYAGGSAVRVTHPADWTDEQHRALWAELSPWGSSGFDGMTDSSYSKGHHLCPEHGVTLTAVGAHWGALEKALDVCCEAAQPVSLGASYVTVDRDWR